MSLWWTVSLIIFQCMVATVAGTVYCTNDTLICKGCLDDSINITCPGDDVIVINSIMSYFAGHSDLCVATPTCNSTNIERPPITSYSWQTSSAVIGISTPTTGKCPSFIYGLLYQIFDFYCVPVDAVAHFGVASIINVNDVTDSVNILSPCYYLHYEASTCDYYNPSTPVNITITNNLLPTYAIQIQAIDFSAGDVSECELDLRTLDDSSSVGNICDDLVTYGVCNITEEQFILRFIGDSDEVDDTKFRLQLKVIEISKVRETSSPQPSSTAGSSTKLPSTEPPKTDDNGGDGGNTVMTTQVIIVIVVVVSIVFVLGAISITACIIWAKSHFSDKRPVEYQGRNDSFDSISSGADV